MRIIALLFLFITSLSVLHAQELSDKEETTQASPPDEAPAYLLNWKLGDVPVDLFFSGYWRLSLVAGGSFGKVTDANSFSGMNRGVTFFQEPDITLSLWLDKRWFLEATFLEGFERNSYRAGYVGAEDEFVREVVLGNTGVSPPSYADMVVPAPKYNTPGIMGRFGTAKTAHNILIRYDATANLSKVFRGRYEVTTENIALPNFVEGRFFILPDTDVSDVRVYLEDKYGNFSGSDGLEATRKYRAAQAGEYFVDGENGLLTLNEPHEGQVAVHYRSNGKEVGDEELGEKFIVNADALRPNLDGPEADFDFAAEDVYDPEGGVLFKDTSKVKIDGRECLILYSPGRFSPFERQNVYSSPLPLPDESWRIVPLLKDRGSLEPVSAGDFNIVPDSRENTISIYSVQDDDPRAPINRYSFAASHPDIYGPSREKDADKVSTSLLLTIRENNAGYFLGAGVVPGSVSVLVNGVRDSTVELSAEGQLVFQRFIHIDDWIEVSYRTETLDMSGGDLYIYQGNRFQFTPRLTWELAESFRWNINRDRAVSTYNQSPGEIAVATSLDWQTDRAGLKLTLRGEVSTPDTAGKLRLFGMDQGGLDWIFFRSTLVRSPDTFGSYLETDRRPADQYSYLSTTALGAEIINNYLWSGAQSSGQDGPALAAPLDGDPVSGDVMELRFNLTGVEWTAADALADSSGAIDLSAYTAMDIPIKFMNLSGTKPQVSLLMGEIGEYEDHHDDGAVNAFDAGATHEFSLDVSETWKTIHLVLTPEIRRKLGRVRAMRIILKAEGGSASGRLIIGPPRFEGSPFRVGVYKDGAAVDKPIAGDEVLDNDPQTAFPEIADLLDSGNNKALRIRWGDNAEPDTELGDGEKWEAVSWFSGVPLDAYRTMVFYFKNHQSGDRMKAEVLDENNRGITLEWTDSTVGWKRFTVNIAEKTVQASPGVSELALNVDTDAGKLTRFVLTGFTDIGAALSGEVRLDEIHFRDPTFSALGSAGLQGYWRYDEDVAAVGDFPLLGNIVVEGQGSIAGGTVFSGVKRGDMTVQGQVGLGADVLFMGLRTDWRLSWKQERIDWSGSHTLRIPARWEVFWIGESYSRGTVDDAHSFSRKNDANLKFSPGSLHLFTEASHGNSILTQSWGGNTQWSGEHWAMDLQILYLIGAVGFDRDSEDYFGSWIHDYQYFLPVTEGIDRREARHTFNGSLKWEPFSVQWNQELRTTSTAAPSWNQENRWAGTLSFPLFFTEWSITPSYRRVWLQSLDTEEPGGFDDTWNTFITGIEDQFPLYTFVPFRELFTADDAKIFERVTARSSATDYSAEFGLIMNRVGGSRIMDLFVPSSADLSLARYYRRQGDTVGWENVWQGTLGFSAANLFGRFGRYPITSLYNSEDIISLLQITLRDFNSIPAPQPQDFLWQFNLSFLGNKSRRLMLDHRVSWHWDEDKRETRQEGRVEFHWRTDSKDALRLPLFKRAIPREHYLESIERLSIRGFYPWPDAPESGVLDLGFILYHETAWVFPELGHFKGWLALGLGGMDETFTNAWEVGIELEVSF